MSDISAPAPAAAPAPGGAPVSGGTDSTAPDSAVWIALRVTGAAGELQLPFVWVDVDPADPGVTAALDQATAGLTAIPVTIEVADQGVDVGGIGDATNTVVQALTDAGYSAGFDGTPDSVLAQVDGVTDAVAGDGSAIGLLAPDGTSYDFGAADPTLAPGDGTDTIEMSTDEFGVDSDGRWQGPLIVEGIPSGDRRVIQENALSWRTLPLPLMLMTRNPDGGEGHAAAELAGNIDNIERRGSVMWGTGQLDLGGRSGQEAYRLMGGPVDETGMPLATGKRGPVFLRGVSADLDQIEARFENELGEGAGIEDLMGFDPGQLIVTKGRIMGATLCPFPAFEEANVQLVGWDDELAAEVDALVASAGYTSRVDVRVWTPWTTEDGALVASGGPRPVIPIAPPRAWLERPTDAELLELRALGRAQHVGADGRIYGFAGIYGELHIGTGRDKVPHSRSGYAYFRTGSVICDDGTEVATGPVCMDSVHPDLTWNASDAATWYHHTGAAVADIAIWDDDKAGGIVYAGALRDGITASQLRVLRGSDGISPDWRKIGGVREVVATLVVNNSGFKTPALVAAGGEEVDLEEFLAKAGDWVAPGTFACHQRAGDAEPMAMVAAGGFAARRPEPNAALLALSLELRSLRTEVTALRATVDPIRAERAVGRLAAMRASREPVIG